MYAQVSAHNYTTTKEMNRNMTQQQNTTEIASRNALKNIIVEGDDGEMTLSTAFVDLQFLYDAGIEDDVREEIENDLKTQLSRYVLKFGMYKEHNLADVFAQDFDWMVNTIVKS